MLNKPEEALAQLPGSTGHPAATSVRNAGIALSLNEMARMQVLLGKNKDALTNFQEALQIRRDIGDKRGLGDTLIDLGNLLR